MRVVALALMLWCLLPWQAGRLHAATAAASQSAAPGENPSSPVLRGLLVGAERFVSHPNTQPAAASNLRRLAAALRKDSRGYARIRTSLNQPLDEAAFGRLVRTAFGAAREGDVSLLYVTSHGLFEEGWDPMDFAVVFSDGQTEHALTARQMHGAFQGIAGIKVLIIDSCNAGALIDRGVPGSGLRSLFTNDEFKVLAASGGSEPSVLWQSGSGSIQGGSYFADALLRGITPADRYAADINRDGDITLSELHTYLLGSYGASTPQAYPLEDDFPVFRYDLQKVVPPPALISGVVFEQEVLNRAENILDYSYTLSQRIRVAYQLIYFQELDWQFASAQYINDGDLSTGEMLPGRKQRSLRIDPPDAEMAGYVLMFLTTVEEDRSIPHAQKLLMVEPGTGDPELTAAVAEGFAPCMGEELAITIGHALPVRLNLRVVDTRGGTVRSLAQNQATRPQHLPAGGSMYYWNGRLRDGEMAPPGQYRIAVDCTIGSRLFTAMSRPFTLR